MCSKAVVADQAQTPFTFRDFEKIMAYPFVIALVLSMKFYGWYGYFTVIFTMAPICLGYVFPSWYMKRSKINYTLIRWIVWLNVLTWISPLFGLFTSVSASL